VGAKGNGAFAKQRIPKGSFIGNYEGEMLSEAAFWERYPNGKVRLASQNIAEICMALCYNRRQRCKGGQPIYFADHATNMLCTL